MSTRKCVMIIVMMACAWAVWGKNYYVYKNSTLYKYTGSETDYQAIIADTENFEVYVIPSQIELSTEAVVINIGTFNLTSITNNGILVNYGVLNCSSAITNNSTGSIINYGTITGGTITNSGTVTNTESGSIENTIANNGTVENAGTISGTVTGDSPVEIDTGVYYWIGASDGEWAESSNWSYMSAGPAVVSGYPGSKNGDTAILAAGDAVKNLASAAAGYSLKIINSNGSSGGRVTIKGYGDNVSELKLTLNGYFLFDSCKAGSLTTEENSKIQITKYSAINGRECSYATAGLYVSGTVTIDSTSEINSADTGEAGDIKPTLYAGGQVKNSGKIFVNNSLMEFHDDYTGYSGSTFTASSKATFFFGNTTFNSGSTFTANSGTVYFFSSSEKTLTTFSGQTFNNLRFGGNVTIDARAGTLEAAYLGMHSDLPALYQTSSFTSKITGGSVGVTGDLQISRVSISSTPVVIGTLELDNTTLSSSTVTIHSGTELSLTSSSQLTSISIQQQAAEASYPNAIHNDGTITVTGTSASSLSIFGASETSRFTVDGSGLFVVSGGTSAFTGTKLSIGGSIKISDNSSTVAANTFETTNSVPAKSVTYAQIRANGWKVSNLGIYRWKENAASTDWSTSTNWEVAVDETTYDDASDYPNSTNAVVIIPDWGTGAKYPAVTSEDISVFSLTMGDNATLTLGDASVSNYTSLSLHSTDSSTSVIGGTIIFENGLFEPPDCDFTLNKIEINSFAEFDAKDSHSLVVNTANYAAACKIVTYGTLTLPGGTVNKLSMESGNLTLNGDMTVTDELVIDDVLNTKGNLTVGTLHFWENEDNVFNAKENSTITVTKAWINTESGIFNHNKSTVVFDSTGGTGVSITGSANQDFYGITVVGSLTADSSLTILGDADFSGATALNAENVYFYNKESSDTANTLTSPSSSALSLTNFYMGGNVKISGTAGLTVSGTCVMTNLPESSADTLEVDANLTLSNIFAPEGGTKITVNEGKTLTLENDYRGQGDTEDAKNELVVNGTLSVTGSLGVGNQNEASLTVGSSGTVSVTGSIYGDYGFSSTQTTPATIKVLAGGKITASGSILNATALTNSGTITVAGITVEKANGTSEDILGKITNTKQITSSSLSFGSYTGETSGADTIFTYGGSITSTSATTATIGTLTIAGATTCTGLTDGLVITKKLSVSGILNASGNKLSLKGTSTTSLAEIDGSGTIVVALDDFTGEYLSIGSGIKICETSGTVVPGKFHPTKSSPKSDTTYAVINPNGWKLDGYIYKWLGTTSTDWNEEENWDIGLVPDSTSIVTYGDSVTNQPVLSSAVTIGHITITEKNSLSLAGYNFTITGDCDEPPEGSTLDITNDFVNKGTVILKGSETVTLNAGKVSENGTWHYKGTDGATHKVKAIPNLSYENLVISGTLGVADGYTINSANGITVGDSSSSEAVTITGTAVFGSAVILVSDATIGTNDADCTVRFKESLDGAKNLTVSGGYIFFHKNIGNTNALSSIVCNVSGTPATEYSLSVCGVTVKTAGDQTYNGAVQLCGTDISSATSSGDTSFISENGNITFNGVIFNDGRSGAEKHSLSATATNTTNGVVSFLDSVGGTTENLLSSVTVTAKSISISGDIKCDGIHSYKGPVTISGDSLLTSATSKQIDFNSDVTIASSKKLSFGTTDDDYSVTVAKNWTNNSGTLVPNKSTVTFTGASATISGTSTTNSGASTFYKAIFNGSGATLSGSNTFSDIATFNASTSFSGNNTFKGFVCEKGGITLDFVSGITEITGTPDSETSFVPLVLKGEASSLLTLSGGGWIVLPQDTDSETYLSASYLSIGEDLVIRDSSGLFYGSYKASTSVPTTTSSPEQNAYAVLYKHGWNLGYVFTYHWTGEDSTHSNSWNEEENWDIKIIPGLASARSASAIVEIPAGKTYYPAVDAPVLDTDILYIKSLKIESGASVALINDEFGADLAIAGTDTNGKPLLENYGTIEFNGACRIVDENSSPINDVEHGGKVLYSGGSEDYPLELTNFYSSGADYANLEITGIVENPYAVEVSGTTLIHTPYDTQIDLASTNTFTGLVTIGDENTPLAKSGIVKINSDGSLRLGYVNCKSLVVKSNAEFTRDNTYESLVCETAGKTLTFDGGTTHTVTEFRIIGTDANKINLIGSGSDEWNITPTDTSKIFIAHSIITNSNNTDSANPIVVYAKNEYNIDGTGNTNWIFAGQEYVWQGADTTYPNEWNQTANWSPASIPKEYAYVIIPSVTSENYPILTADLNLANDTHSFNFDADGDGNNESVSSSITLEESTVFDFNGHNLTVNTLKSQGRIRVQGNETIASSGSTGIVNFPLDENNFLTGIIEYYGNFGTALNWGTKFSQLEFTNGATGSSSDAISVSGATLILNGGASSLPLTLNGNNIFDDTVTIGNESILAGNIKLGGSTSSGSAFSIAENAKSSALTIISDVKLLGNVTTTQGNQAYKGNIVFAQNSYLDAGASAINFTSDSSISLSSSYSLTLKSNVNSDCNLLFNVLNLDFEDGISFTQSDDSKSITISTGTVDFKEASFIAGNLIILDNATFVQTGVNSETQSVRSIKNDGKCVWDASNSGGSLTVFGNITGDNASEVIFNKKNVVLSGANLEISGIFYDLVIPEGCAVTNGERITVRRNFSVNGSYLHNEKSLILGSVTVNNGDTEIVFESENNDDGSPARIASENSSLGNVTVTQKETEKTFTTRISAIKISLDDTTENGGRITFSKKLTANEISNQSGSDFEIFLGSGCNIENTVIFGTSALVSIYSEETNSSAFENSLEHSAGPTNIAGTISAKTALFSDTLLTGDATIDCGTESVTFTSTVDSDISASNHFSLTIGTQTHATNANFATNVGVIKPLSSLTVYGSTNLLSDVIFDAGEGLVTFTQKVIGNDSLTLESPVSLGGNVTTSLSQTYKKDLTLTADVDFTAGEGIYFDSALPLSLNAVSSANFKSPVNANCDLIFTSPAVDFSENASFVQSDKSKSLTLASGTSGTALTFSTASFDSGNLVIETGSSFTQTGVNSASDGSELLQRVYGISNEGICIWDGASEGGTLELAGSISGTKAGEVVFNKKNVTISANPVTISGVFFDLEIPEGIAVTNGAGIAVRRNLLVNGTYAHNNQNLTLGSVTVNGTKYESANNDDGSAGTIAGTIYSPSSNLGNVIVIQETTGKKFTSNIEAISLSLEDTTIGAGSIEFVQNLSATSITNTTGTDFAILFDSSCVITDAVTFNTSGNLTLGTTEESSCTFTGGITHTVGVTNFAGNLSSAFAQFAKSLLTKDTLIDCASNAVTFYDVVDSNSADSPCSLTIGTDSSPTNVVFNSAVGATIPLSSALFYGNAEFTANLTTKALINFKQDVISSGAGVVLKSNNSYILYDGSSSRTIGAQSGKSIEFASDTYIDVSSASTVTLSSDISWSENLYSYSGDIVCGAVNLSVGKDFVIFGSNYSADDPRFIGTDTRFAYYGYEDSVTPLAYKPATGTSGFATTLTTTGTNITVGKNLYVNGLDISNSTFKIPDNSTSHPVFNPSSLVTENQWGLPYAVVFNSTVSNCSASAVLGTAFATASYYQGITNGSGNTGFQFEIPKITEAYSVSDSVICLSFDMDLENSNMEVETTVALVSSLLDGGIFYNGGTVAFDGIFYTQSDGTTCSVPLSESAWATSDIPAGTKLYLKVSSDENTWNTDATASSSGSEDSSDRSGAHRNCTTDLSLFEGLFYSANGKTMCKNYGIGLWKEESESSYVTAKIVPTIDKARPVLVDLLTGQELHATNTGSAESQKPYDSHNFIELRYSEPVDIGDLPAGATSDNQNVQAQTDFDSATSHGGAIIPDSTGLTLKGFAKIASGSIKAGYRDGNDHEYDNAKPHSLYRKFSRYATSSEEVQSCRIRISVAGYVDTENPVTIDGKSFNSWIGFIDSSESPSGHVTPLANSFITDLAVGADGSTLLKNIFDPNNSSRTINVTEPSPSMQADSESVPGAITSLYGDWDCEHPVFAPYIKSADGSGTYSWGEGDSDTRTYEIIGMVTSNTSAYLDHVEFHLFDNAQEYKASDTYKWISQIGWTKDGSAIKTINHSAPELSGGEKQFSMTQNMTRGGIRRSSLKDAVGAFEYKYTIDDESSATRSFGGTEVSQKVKSPLFRNENLTITSTDDDGLYLALTLNDKDTILPIRTGFTVTYYHEKSFITDLAGNRLLHSDDGSKKTLRSVDITPPSFSVVLSPIGENKLYAVFTKPLAYGRVLLQNRTDLSDILEKIRNNIEFVYSLGDDIDTGNYVSGDDVISIEKVELSSYSDSYTSLIFTLDRSIRLNDIEKIWLRINGEGEDAETFSGTIKASYFRDISENSIPYHTCHSISDFAVNAVNVLYGYSVSDEDEGWNEQGIYGTGVNPLSSDYATHDFSAEGGNYAKLRSGHDILFQLQLVGGVNSSGNYGFQNKEELALVIDKKTNLKSSWISDKFNLLTKKDWRIWLDAKLFAIASDYNHNPLSGNPVFENVTGSDLLKNMTITNDDYKFTNKEEYQFFFKIRDPEKTTGMDTDENDCILINNDGDKTTPKIPLYAFRMPTEKISSGDYSFLDLWSFTISSITAQRGGVTILNNVINASVGEKTAIEVDMPSSGNLNVFVMTLDGNIVQRLSKGNVSQGKHYFYWDGKNMAGNPVARGLYFVRVSGNGIDETRKVMVVK